MFSLNELNFFTSSIHLFLNINSVLLEIFFNNSSLGISIKIFINIPRSDLLKKISKRTDLMFKENCLAEVKNFNKLKLNKNLSANKLIGVHEINLLIKDIITLDECKELINIKTRQYAKRQNTWARGHMKNWNKLYSKDFSILLKKTLKVIS